MFTLEREVEYLGEFFKVVEELNSDLLLVVKKEEHQKGVFPLQTYVIPSQ